MDNKDKIQCNVFLSMEIKKELLHRSIDKYGEANLSKIVAEIVEEWIKKNQ